MKYWAGERKSLKEVSKWKGVNETNIFSLRAI